MHAWHITSGAASDIGLTRDHSLVHEQGRSGLLTDAEALRATHTHVLTRTVWIRPLVDVELREMPFVNGDRLLLCSNGLTVGVSADTILHVMMETPDLQAAANRLVTLSNDAGGSDNTTVVVVKVAQRQSGLWDRFYDRLFP